MSGEQQQPQRYSTLEVVPGDHPEYYETHKEEVVQQLPSGDGVQDGSQRAPDGARGTRKIIIIAVVVVVIVIGAVLGGVLGTQLQRSGGGDSESSNNPTPSSSATPNLKIMENSKLSAVTFRSSYEGDLRRFVAFQDPSGDVMICLWNETDKSWMSQNINESLGSSLAIQVADGSPLAGVAADYQADSTLWLFYQDKSGQVQGLWWDTVATDEKILHGMHYSEDISNANMMSYGSSLSAIWQQPYVERSKWGQNHRGWWIVAYQEEHGGLQSMNSSSDLWTRSGWIFSEHVAPNTSMSMIPYAEEQGSQPTTVNLLWQSNTHAVVTRWNRSNWESDNIIYTDIRDLPNTPSPVQFATTALEDWNKTMYLTLMPNGTVRGLNKDAGSAIYPYSSPLRFLGGPEDVNFSSIGATTDGMFYGISGDQVLEYAINQSSSIEFHYVGPVYG